jgi:hypothetical protein
MTTTRPDPTVAAIVQQLATLDYADLVALLHELCDRSAETRAFLAIRVLGQPDGDPTLDSHRQHIEQVFYPPTNDRAVPFPDTLTDTLALVHRYHQTTDDLVGALDLLLTFAENGTHLRWQWGGLDDGYVEHISQSYDDLAALLRLPGGTDIYPQFRERLIALMKKANAIESGDDGTASDSLYAFLCDMEGTDEEAWGLTS